jgi:CRP-like cAMP-binding protein
MNSLDREQGPGKNPDDAIHAALPGLAPRELELVSRYSAPASVRGGRALYYQGDSGSAAFLVVSGRIRPYRLKSGSSSALDDAGPGSWLGLAETYLDLPYLADALAVESSQLRRFGRYNLFELLKEPRLKDLALGVLAREHYCLHDRLDASSATEKVARVVCARSGGPTSPATVGEAGTLRLAMTQSDIAEASGLARETVNRCLRRLEEAGLLETSRGEILVYDLRGLRAYEE